MPVTHEPWLVALSFVMAIQGSYVGLSLAVQVGASTGLRRRLLLAAAALSLALAVWSMHFVGMLAARLPFPVDYLVLPTLLSFLVCVLVVGAAVFAVTAGPPTPVRLAAAAVAMGGGIVSMHYIGMSALHASAHMHHAYAFVVASVIIAIAASGLALRLASGHGGRPPLLLSAVALGVAISGMHYTAMAGLTLHSVAQPIGAPALSTDLLAIVVAVVAFLVSGIFLLALVPERARAGAAQALPSSLGDIPALAGAAPPPPRFARHLPIEHDGATRFVAVDAVVAVHANAHYTTVFDGSAKLFCPLAISEVEARRFLRVHRSHIVNIDHVVRLKRVGDGGVLELDVAGVDKVPVSRSRFAGLKSTIVSRSHALAS
jgi:NO-binding membrane sensor protein with MHYT domain